MPTVAEEQTEESGTAEQAPPKTILLKGERLGDSPGTVPRLSDWPSLGSRWQLQTELDGTLEFELGTVEHGDQLQAVEMLSFDESWFIVRIGPVGEWYRNDSVYLLIDVATRAVHAAGVYEYSDLGGGHWGTANGTVRIDPTFRASDGRVRGALDLFHDESGTTPWFQGTFEVSTSAPPGFLRHNLESFGVSFPE